MSLVPPFSKIACESLETSLGIEIPHAIWSNSEAIIFGGLIIFFLIVEPNGLARLWQITKEKLRLWPFPH
jgi:branched-chain amino acid transport system permease protein